jgi:hypothetical protein
VKGRRCFFASQIRDLGWKGVRLEGLSCKFSLKGLFFNSKKRKMHIVNTNIISFTSSFILFFMLFLILKSTPKYSKLLKIPNIFFIVLTLIIVGTLFLLIFLFLIYISFKYFFSFGPVSKVPIFLFYAFNILLVILISLFSQKFIKKYWLFILMASISICFGIFLWNWLILIV